MDNSLSQQGVPNFRRDLFWDSRFEDIDWPKAYRAVMERILTRGDNEDYEELIRYYGYMRVVEAMTKEYVFLPDYIMDRAAAYFGLKKEDLTVWKRRQQKAKVWI